MTEDQGAAEAAEDQRHKDVRVVFSGGAELRLSRVEEAEVDRLKRCLAERRQFAYRARLVDEETVIQPDQTAYIEVVAWSPSW